VEWQPGGGKVSGAEQAEATGGSPRTAMRRLLLHRGLERKTRFSRPTSQNRQNRKYFGASYQLIPEEEQTF